MPTDLLEIALRNEEFAKDVMANPDLSNKAIAVIDRIMDFFGEEILDAKIEGPNIAPEGFDVTFKLTTKSAK